MSSAKGTWNLGNNQCRLAGEEEGDLERKWLAFQGASHSVLAPAAASSTESSASSERACAYNQVEGGFVLSSVFILFLAALQSLKRQNLKMEIEEGKQGEKDLLG